MSADVCLSSPLSQALASVFFAPKSFIQTLSSLIISKTVNLEEGSMEGELEGTSCSMEKADAPHLIDESSASRYHGCLIRTEEGGGKTYLLRQIKHIYSSKCFVSYLDLATIRDNRRGYVESKLLRFISEERVGQEIIERQRANKSAKTSYGHLVLLDNIDSLCEDSQQGFLSGRISALLEMLQRQRLGQFIVATFTRIEKIPPTLLNSESFKLLRLRCPVQQEREVAMREILKQFTLLASARTPTLSLTTAKSNVEGQDEEEGERKGQEQLRETLAREVANITQGSLIPDLIAIVSNAAVSTQLQQNSAMIQTVAAESHSSLKAKSSNRYISESELMKRAIASRPSHIDEMRELSYLVCPAVAKTTLVGEAVNAALERLKRVTIEPFRRMNSDINSTTAGQGHVNSPYGARNMGAAVRLRAMRELTKGVIICGPSGCGKTALSRQLAYECRSHFKLISISCAELVNKVLVLCMKLLS